MHRIQALMMICILVALPALVSAQSAIPGWGKAKWGMTHAALKKHFDLSPWEPGSIPTCKSQKKIRIWGHDFSVAFYFDERSAGGKLFKVALVHFDNTPENSAWINSIKDMLVEKYGTPGSFEIKKHMKISQWKEADGQLTLTTLADQTVMCALEYMAVRMEGKKL